ncbi:MAG TPA: DUF4349 domain-containing protein [Gemmatimonadales bacterium]|nr:DUF4349 domain-containing protein [Gemmatimonadales bacterium]
MRVQTMVVGLLQAALLTACDRSASISELSRERVETVGQPSNKASDAADAVSLGTVGEREVAASSPPSEDQWSRQFQFDPATRLIVRTGQASIEVDSLEPAMTELRRIVQRAGGFVADASVQSGRNQLRQATLELKVPSTRFDELTEGLQPIGRLEFVNVGAEDVSEEFVDLTARVANGRRLEDRLVELLRTRTGKLQDVLSVERELARVREEIERMEGRLRYLKASAQLSTLSVSLHEPVPIVATHGPGPIVEAFRAAWRNFVGVLAGAIASLGFVVPVLGAGWAVVGLGRRWRRVPRTA